MTGWQRDKMAGLGKTVSGKQIVVEASGQGYTYRIHRFEDGKYAATTTHRFLSKDYADRFEQDKENYLGLSAAEADKGRLYIRYEDGSWGQYRNKTWQEVYGILKAQITEEDAAAAKYNLPAGNRLVE
jgi:hypothetical protein